MTTHKLTIGYARTSLAEQGHSLQDQTERIEVACAGKGWRLDEVIREEASGKSTKRRPGYTRLVGMVRSGRVGRIIVTRLDRASRSVIDLAALVALCDAQDVALVSLSEAVDTASAVGRMQAHLIGCLAQWERETIVERVTRAVRTRKEKGVPLGARHPNAKPLTAAARALGVAASVQVRAERSYDRTSSVLPKVLKLRKGGFSLSAIARELSMNGERWHATQVARIVAAYT
jgi:DNA invertase Pin-like site-specific DNA recombinase